MGNVLQKFSYQLEDQKYFPIPSHEKLIQTVEAEYFFQVRTERAQRMEGLCFDRDGFLWFVDMYNNRICQMDVNKKVIFNEVAVDPERRATAVKIHKDGRLFVACIDLVKKGCVYSMNQDGSDMQMIVSDYSIDDLVFDSEGGFYATHFIGSPTNPTGAILYVSPDFKTVTPVIENLAAPNGIALSSDGNFLWITEHHGNRLLRYILKGPQAGVGRVAYWFTGSASATGPDSICIDADDNVYVAIAGHGRVMIFNRNGMPIGQVVLPGRERGSNLCSFCPAVRPDICELYIVSSDDRFDEGSWIFRTCSFAPGNKTAYQFQYQ